MKIVLFAGKYAYYIDLLKGATVNDLINAIIREQIFFNRFEFSLYTVNQKLTESDYDSFILQDDEVLFAGPNGMDFIDVVVYNVDGSKYTFEVNLSVTFNDIMSVLSRTYGINFSSNYLMFNQKIVDPTKVLGTELRSPYPTFFIIPNTNPTEYAMVYVQLGNTIMMEVDVGPESSIYFVKREIERLYHINKSQIDLYLSETYLADETVVFSLVSRTSVLFLTARFHGVLDLEIRFNGMGKKYMFDADETFGHVAPELIKAFQSEKDKTIYFRGDKVLPSTFLWSFYDTRPKFTISSPFDESYAKLIHEKYLKLTETSEPSSCYAYGMMLINGTIVDKDLEEGVRYLSLAMEKRHIQACIAYVKLVQDNIIAENPEINLEKAIQFAAESNDRSGIYFYARFLERVNRTLEAEKYFRQASNMGYVLATTHLGRMAINGARSVTRDEGFLLLDQSARAGHASALKTQAKLIAPNSASESVTLMEKASANGSPGASLYLAHRLLNEGDTEQGAKYLQKSAEIGNVKAMRYYGIALHRGKIVKKDSKLAYEYLKKASDAGDVPARYHLSKLLIKGEGIDPSAETAVVLLSSIYMMCIPAAILLCNMKLRGIGCPKDVLHALEIARFAMSQGSYKAMRIVGMMEKEGIGCQKDEYLAREHFKEASEHDVIALFQYALMLKISGDDENTLKLVFQLLERAADQGLPDAHQELALMFMGQDYTKAIFHFDIAARAGLPLSMYWLAHLWMQNSEITNLTVKYMKGAADLNVPQACFEYSRMVAEGRAPDAPPSDEMIYLEKATSLGFKDAQVELGIKEFKEGNFEGAAKHLREALDAGIFRGVSFYVLALEKLNYPVHEVLRWDRIGAEHQDIICMMRLGHYHISTNKFEEAASVFMKAMEQGSYDAIYEYACLLEGGKGIERNLPLAIEYHKRAVDMGVTDSLIALGRILTMKDFEGRDPPEALNYYRLAANNGSYEALYHIARMLREGDAGVAPDQSTAFNYFKEAYEHEYWPAAYDLAVMTDRGEGCMVNGEASMNYFKVGIEHDVLKCYAPYARNIFFGINAPRDTDLSRKIMLSGVEKKDPDSTFLYAEILAAEGDLQAATKFYLMAGDEGNIEAMNSAAVILEQNVETVTKAAELFQKAADLGDPIAACNIGIMLASGHGVLRDYNKAMTYMQRAVKYGNVEAMYNLAVLMVKMNKNGMYDTELREYFKRAADGGNTQAMYNYGVLLTEKEPKDFKTGMKYLRNAAVRGISLAAYKFAYNILIHSESKKDDEVALEFCKQAIADQNLDALCLYGVMLLNGRGTQASTFDAMQCFKIGVENNHVNSMYNYAMVTLNSNPDAKTYVEAINLLKHAAELGSESAIQQLEVYRTD